jgi:hypothetical protein
VRVTSVPRMEPAKWKCEKCESVCEGEKGLVPTPCDFCGSEEIVEVSMDTPEAPPKSPWDDPANWVVQD